MPRKFVKLDKLAMAKGYQEMGSINLSISEVFYGNEEEGWKLGYGEMDSEKTED